MVCLGWRRYMLTAKNRKEPQISSIKYDNIWLLCGWLWALDTQRQSLMHGLKENITFLTKSQVHYSSVAPIVNAIFFVLYSCNYDFFVRSPSVQYISFRYSAVVSFISALHSSKLEWSMTISMTILIYIFVLFRPILVNLFQ